MRDEPVCGVCGHYRWEHRPESLGGCPSGSPVSEFFHGRCVHLDGTPYHTGRSCHCVAYREDFFPAVTELLGFDARRDIERAAGAEPFPRTRPREFDYREGDLIDVTYERATRRYRIAYLSDVRYEGVLVLELEPVDDPAA